MRNPVVIYIHGFNSSPRSRKADVIRQWVAVRNAPIQVEVPALPYSPSQSAGILERLVQSFGDDRPIGLIGSSLGGYYATWLAERYSLPAVLVNPAVRPYELLADYLGENVNIYTGERYRLTSEHIQELLDLDVSRLARPENFFLLVQTGDQTLDYRQATVKYAGCKAWLEAGGTHEFAGFDAALPAALAFLGFPHYPPQTR